VTNIHDTLAQWFQQQPTPYLALNHLREIIHTFSPNSQQPVDLVRWIPFADVEPNDYNPNAVASTELNLLAISIQHDGYTQPVVTIYDPERHKYIIVDGFHRYFSMKTNPDIWEATGGLLPVVVIDKPINDRMASTIRHNRARGKHLVKGMSQMVFQLLEQGWDDAEICNQLGMAPEELIRLKHITGFSKLYANAEYRQAWMTERQVRIAHMYHQSQGNGGTNGATDDISQAPATPQQDTPHG